MPVFPNPALPERPPADLSAARCSSQVSISIQPVNLFITVFKCWMHRLERMSINAKSVWGHGCWFAAFPPPAQLKSLLMPITDHLHFLSYLISFFFFTESGQTIQLLSVLFVYMLMLRWKLRRVNTAVWARAQPALLLHFAASLIRGQSEPPHRCKSGWKLLKYAFYLSQSSVCYFELLTFRKVKQVYGD